MNKITFEDEYKKQMNKKTFEKLLKEECQDHALRAHIGGYFMVRPARSTTNGKTHDLLQHSTALISGLFRIM